MIYVIIIASLIIVCIAMLSFYVGTAFADRYHRLIIAEYQYMLRQYGAVFGIGYTGPAPYEERSPIGSDFMERLHRYGRATQALHPKSAPQAARKQSYAGK